MKILVLGGSGAMGTPLLEILKDAGHEIHATSRQKRDSVGIIWHCGNAHDEVFIQDLLKENFDAVVDFMSYKTKEFQYQSKMILPKVGQYFFLSSARVYAKSDKPLREDSPRLLDVCDDQDYLKTDEYALTKARQENILVDSKFSNWMIIRPSLTYNDERLQYVLGEKEVWLYRSLIGKKVVFPTNLSQIFTTMSHGDDVAKAISLLVGKSNIMKTAVHIAGAKAITWKTVNNIYKKTLLEKASVQLNLFEINDWVNVSRHVNFYQMKYARSISRTFDNTKLYELIGNIDFRPPEIGLSECLSNFIVKQLHFRKINWKNEAIYDRITREFGPIKPFSSKEKIKYLILRTLPLAFY